MPDITLVCASCQESFAFSEKDQAFFAEKGFQQPRKCRPCRDAAKQSRGGGGGYGGGRSGGGGYGGGGGYDRPKRQLFDAVCSACGVDTQVPFEPTGAKPVYCRDCFQQNASRY
jgi:CxxC-x17-CxxC domain-containing protein